MASVAAPAIVCKGGRCDDSTESCFLSGRCLYRSSADEAKEVLSAARTIAVTQEVRTFPTGATRNVETTKLDYEGFLSPLALRRYAEYMHKHRVQSDGSTRDSDNWQKGIPIASYMKSMWRHFMDVWMSYRGYQKMSEEELCALFFNVQGLLHECVKAGLK